jgi:hypothetical protein
MSFLVFRTESAIDLRDFRSLAGVDALKAIRQIFLVGGTERPGRRFEHSVIALGRFNRRQIYQVAIQNGVRVGAYRGIDLVEVNPFSRDQPAFNDPRWLAVIAPHLAVFGTIANVREEIDRYADHVPVDSPLLERFGRFDQMTKNGVCCRTQCRKMVYGWPLGRLMRAFLISHVTNLTFNLALTMEGESMSIMNLPAFLSRMLGPAKDRRLGGRFWSVRRRDLSLVPQAQPKIVVP